MIYRRKHKKYVYTEKDIQKNYVIGLEMGVTVLEKSLGLTIEGQRELVKALKDYVIKEKVKAVMDENT